ncbi:MAG: amino acid permease [Nanobdellota archaeon]
MRHTGNALANILNKEDKGNKTTLKRTLGVGALFLIALNAIFASSLTYLPGIAIQKTGPSSLLPWIGVILIGIYIAMCLSELISTFPTVGDVYLFAKKAFGHFTAFLVGWTSWIAGNIVSSLAVVWALEYLYPHGGISYLTKLIIGIAFIIILNLVVFMGMDLSSIVLIILALITISVLALQIIPFFINLPEILQSGASLSSNFNFANFKPFFIHEGLGTNAIFLFATLFMISEAFMGMEQVTFLSKETKNPGKTVPKALMRAIITVGAVMAIYTLGSIGVYSIEQYAGATIPYKNIISIIWQGAMVPILNIGSAIFIIAPAVSWMVTGPRVVLSLAEDKLTLKQLGKINKKTKTPENAIIFQTIAITLFTVFLFVLYMMGHHDPYLLVHEVFIVLVLFILAVTVLALPVIRKKYPYAKPHYKAPFGNFGPIATVVIFLIMGTAYFYVTREFHVLYKAITLIGVGIPLYMILVLNYNPEATKKIYEKVSTLSYYFENIFFPKWMRRKIAMMFGSLEGKRVLEVGASVGTLTMELAKRTGPRGKIYAIDFAKANIKLLKKRAERKHHMHIVALHDEHMISRVHPDIPQVDVIFSMGVMDHIQNMKQIAKDMAAILPENGKICMVEYSDYFFGLLPNSGWIADIEELQKIFREAGFSTRVVKWKGGLWNYTCIYGLKNDEDVVLV